MLKLFSLAASQHKRNENYQLWTHENHAEEVFGAKFTLQRVLYIHENPVHAGIVLRADEYLYSSAKDYVGETELVKVYPLDLHLLMS